MMVTSLLKALMYGNRVDGSVYIALMKIEIKKDRDFILHRFIESPTMAMNTDA